jgi:hypothetical protein
VYVNMAALAHISDDAADIMTVFQHGVANFEIAEGNLVTERNGVERLEA